VKLVTRHGGHCFARTRSDDGYRKIRRSRRRYDDDRSARNRHRWAKDGTLLRVDCERGISWVATHYGLNLRVIQQVRGSDEEVHRVAARWAQVVPH
jgi:hypothetical protein